MEKHLIICNTSSDIYWKDSELIGEFSFYGCLPNRIIYDQNTENTDNNIYIGQHYNNYIDISLDNATVDMSIISIPVEDLDINIFNY